MDGVRLIEPPDLLPYRFRNGGLSPVDLAARLSTCSASATTSCTRSSRDPGRRFPASWRDEAECLGGGLGRSLGARRHGCDLAHAAASHARRVRRRPAVLHPSPRRRRHRDQQRPRAPARSLGIPPERIRRITVGANDDLFRPQPAGEARARFGLPEDALVLVHTGFAPFDDWLLAHTFAELATAEPRAHLLMSGRRFPLVEERAAAVGAGNRVVHVGVVPYRELGSVMSCGDVMVVPYTAQPHNEARFPNRACDYLAAGRPIATNPTGDLARLVTTERSASSRRRRPRRSPARSSTSFVSPRCATRWDARARARRDDALLARRCCARRRSVRRAGPGVEEGGRGPAILIELVVREPPRFTAIPAHRPHGEPQRRGELRDDHHRQVPTKRAPVPAVPAPCGRGRPCAGSPTRGSPPPGSRAA